MIGGEISCTQGTAALVSAACVTSLHLKKRRRMLCSRVIPEPAGEVVCSMII